MHILSRLSLPLTRFSALLRAASAPACALALLLAPAAHASDSQVLLGGGAGAAAGAVIGQTMGGSTGAIIGGAIGGATGAAATTHGSRQSGAILGGAVGGAAGAVVGQSVGGRTGAVIGAGAGGAIGAGMGRGHEEYGGPPRTAVRYGPQAYGEDHHHNLHETRWSHGHKRHHRKGHGHGWGHERD